MLGRSVTGASRPCARVGLKLELRHAARHPFCGCLSPRHTPGAATWTCPADSIPTLRIARSLSLRQRAHSRRLSSSMASPRFSDGEDQSQTEAALSTLLAPTGKWQLCKDGAGIERPFKFKTFKAAWAFMNTVAEQCKKQRHHPEWSNVYSACYVRWTTHQPAGLSSKDVQMAQFCDQAATRDDSREIVLDSADESTEGLRAAADRVTQSAPDCCTPKKQ